MRNLPSEYQEVEYIQSSGTQYINTGYTGSSNTKIDTKLSITTRVGNYDFFYGSSGDGTGGQPCTFIQYNYPDNNKIRVVNYANSGSNKRYVDSINNLEYGKIYNIIHTNTNFIIDGVSQGTMSATTYTLTYPLWIFGVNNRGSFAQPCAMKLYSFKIYESLTLVRDLVPCYRKADDVIGLYDIVNNQFYTNAGTGTFTKGGDVKGAKIQRIYVGSNLVRPANPYSPTVNTKLYYPLRFDQKDVTGNTSIAVTGTKENIGYKFSKSSSPYTITFNNSWGLGIRFFSYWVYCNTLPSNTYIKILNTEYAFMNFVPTDSNSSHAKNFIYVMGTTSSPYTSDWYYSGSKTITLNSRNHLAYGIASNGQYIATINGSVVWSGTRSGTQYHNSSFPPDLIGGNGSYAVTFSDIIGEDRVWTSQEISDYYNKTKSNYGK